MKTEPARPFVGPAAILLAAALFVGGCDRRSAQDKEAAEAEAPTSTRQSVSNEKAGGDEAEHEDHGEEGEHADEEHSHEVHLGAAMYEITRRFSAIWYAGRAENTAMVDYQVHEIEEVVEELKPADPQEGSVDVVDRFESDVLPGLEKLETIAESGDTKTFESKYREVMGNCAQCHQDTGYGFINPGIPEYNPYPNLDMKVGK